MAAGYSIPESDALGMLGDAHSTNYAENRDFFLNQNNPTNFERTWTHRVLPLQEDQRGHRADAVRSGDGLLRHPEARAPSRSTRARRTSTTSSSRRRRAGTVQGEKDEILTKTVVIHFFPNSWDLNKKITRNADGKEVEELYDPNVGFVVEEIGKLAGPVRRGAHRHRGAHRRVDEGVGAEEPGAGAVAQPRELGEGGDRSGSSRRCSPTSSRPPGMGWDRPADPSDPDNNAKNRRVEVKVYPAEAAPATK